MILNVSHNELDTILAALRYWQSKRDYIDPELWAVAGEHGKPISNDAICELCMRMNCPDSLETLQTALEAGQLAIDVIKAEQTKLTVEK